MRPAPDLAQATVVSPEPSKDVASLQTQSRQGDTATSKARAGHDRPAADVGHGVISLSLDACCGDHRLA